jgi:hypothetical protein
MPGLEVNRSASARPTLALVAKRVLDHGALDHGQAMTPPAVTG